MYAAFREDETAPAEQQSSSVFLSAAANLQHSEISKADDNPPPNSGGVSSAPAADKRSIIGALRMYVLHGATAPPPQWRRYRHQLPASLGELKLVPPTMESLGYLPSATFVLQLNTTPEKTVEEYCSELISYLMTHARHANAQAPLLMVRFVKVGLEIAQCVVTVGNNDVELSRQLATNLREVGFTVGFGQPRPVHPTATFQVWDVKRCQNDSTAEPIDASDLERIFSSDGPNGLPAPGSVSVCKGVEDGLWYVCAKRPDACFAWLMNPMSSWLFQRELFDKLGIFVTLVPCDHDWAQPRRPPGQWGQPNFEVTTLRSGGEEWKAHGGSDSDEGSGSDEDAAELLVKSNIDIFGGETSATAPVAADDALELVADEDDDDVSGLLGSAPDVYDMHNAPQWSPNGSFPSMPPSMFMPPPPVYGSFPNGMPPPPTYSTVPFPHTLGAPPPRQGLFPSPGLPYGSVLRHEDFRGGLNDQHANSALSSSPIPDIVMPVDAPIMHASQLDVVLTKLHATDPRRMFSVLSDKENYAVLLDFANGSMDLSSNDHAAKLDALVDALLQAAGPSNESPLRFKPKPIVLDICFQDRHVSVFPLLTKLLKCSGLAGDRLRSAAADRIVSQLHRIPFKTLAIALLEGDTTVKCPLVSAISLDPVLWCADAATVTRQHLFAYPHLMVPYGTNGLKTIFDKCSREQREALTVSIRSLSSAAAHELLDKADLLGRAFIVAAAGSGIVDAAWLIDKLGCAPQDNRCAALLVDFACVVVYGRGDTLLCDAMLEYAGWYCANLDMCTDTSVTDEQRLEFLHSSILRRFFAPAQDKYPLLRAGFMDHYTSPGVDGAIYSVLTSPVWPKRPAVAAAKQEGPAQRLGAVLATPAVPPKPEPKVVVISFEWNDEWTKVFADFPATGEPFPIPEGATWKFSTSKSYGHYYFKADDKGSKPSYKHPETGTEYMVSPQAFVQGESSWSVDTFLGKCSSAERTVTQEEYSHWLSDQRLRDKLIDETVLRELKITYRSHSASVATAATAVAAQSTDVSDILKAQRALERKLRFVQELKYPPRGHPFPALPKGWSCSLSASNGLYYFKSGTGRSEKTTYVHPVSKLEYAPTPQAYAFFDGIKEQLLLQKLASAGVTAERVTTWLGDQTVRDSLIDYFVAERLGVRYGRNRKRDRSKSRSQSPHNSNPAQPASS